MVEADCMDWLRHNNERYGVIFLDPPTFSNARHRKLTFDIQNDQVALLRLVMQRLAKAGVLIFSTNFRKFKLAEALLEEFIVEEISEATIPPDFRRNHRIHRCWEIRHRQAPSTALEMEPR
jgi:23S rRNA (guanine2445-N2)-methyltransferase / 23S rRNA (guanine2069-N7)-methyltransferase